MTFVIPSFYRDSRKHVLELLIYLMHCDGIDNLSKMSFLSSQLLIQGSGALMTKLYKEVTKSWDTSK